MKLGKNTKFQYISDLHLETYKGFPKLPVAANNLILAGDIGNPFKSNYRDFLSYCSTKYEKTFLIPGNHEYWNHKSIYETDSYLFDITSKLNNVTFMKNKVTLFQDTFIVGCVLWSTRNTKNTGGDEEKIRVNAEFLNNLHVQDVNWLRLTLNSLIRYNKKVLVVTHYLPSFNLMHEKYKNYPHPDRFYSNSDHLIENPIDTWICGHTHCTMEKNINGVNFLVNSLGYVDNFQNKIKTVEIQ